MRNAIPVFFIALLLPAQTIQRAAEISAQETNEDSVVISATEKIRERYVRIVCINRGSKIVAEATGVRLDKKLLVTNFHVMEPDTIIAQVAKGPDGKEKCVPLKIVAVEPLLDLAIVQTTDEKELPAITFALRVRPGETLIDYSNANGLDGMAGKYTVGRAAGKDLAEDDWQMILSPPCISGESGAGVFNLRGELAGIMTSNRADSQNGFTKQLYANAIPAFALQSLLKEAGIVLGTNQ